MEAIFWGVRGSIPTPAGPKEIRQKIIEILRLALAEGVRLENENQLRAYIGGLPPLKRGMIGGNTACVEVRSEAEWEEALILDAGSGIRPLGLEMMKGSFGRGEGTAHLFLSHTHWDHIMGFPFFAPAFVPGNRIRVYGAHENLEERIERQQMPEHFPVPLESMGAEVEFVHLNRLNIAACQACNDGWGTCRSEGVCVQKDDLEALREKVADADALVFSTPVYFGDLSESAKCLFDRWRRCEVADREGSSLKGIWAIGIAAAGGSGGGAVTALRNLEGVLRWLQFGIFDLVPVTQRSKVHKLAMLEQAGRRLAEEIGRA